MFSFVTSAAISILLLSSSSEASIITSLRGASSSVTTEKPVYGLYLAGPEVFLGDPIAAGEFSKKECEKVNNEELPFVIDASYPLDAQIEDFAHDQATGLKIFKANVGLMDASLGTVANMVRFRSPSMDVGTAWEEGYTMGSSKPVFGYYDAAPFYGQEEDPGTYGEKVQAYGFSEEQTGYDKDGLEIEGFGFSDNLMLLGNLDDTGYPQRKSIYESCLDAVDWIKKNCPSDKCLPVNKKND